MLEKELNSAAKEDWKLLLWLKQNGGMLVMERAIPEPPQKTNSATEARRPTVMLDAAALAEHHGIMNP